MSKALDIEAMQFYEDHPDDFCRDMIGIELDDWQKEAFESLYDDHFIAIKAGSGVGKTVWMSLATMHFLGTKPQAKVPTTAPSQHQLQDLLWGEHFKNISKSPYLGEMMHWTQTKVSVKGHEPSWFAVARTARVSPTGKVAEGLQGFHAEENLMYLVDEASGVPDEIYPAIEGALTGKKAYAVLAANPTRLTGYFYSVFTDPRMKGLYKCFTISCEDSKYIEERYLTMMEARYGRNHPIFRIKVLGEFPTSDIEVLFPLADVEKMRNNDVVDMRGDRSDVEIGVDIGRTTSKSIMCIRKGMRIKEFQKKHLSGTTVDAVEITQWILDAIHAYNPSSVKIDANGIGGPIFDSLARVYPRIVRPVIGQAQPDPTKRQRYVNLRAQGYWELKEILPLICCSSWPEEVFEEIIDMRYKMPNGKIQIESKEDIVRRNGSSPDYIDSMVYAFLDSKVCVDKFNPITIPLYLGEVNASLDKKNPLLDMNSVRFHKDLITSNKWGALHG